ncbi:hypothetical protein A3D00_01990 [Candidatus Woesebacteria bacterium RIFCSPHIGHO2_02_FULL_38_9]|uniref:Glycosyltransferase RgtA/B/C/D-like domain-containing protein n=1 Tax=Candidatus Woesebacteria bacterium RIFCSPHIGHO2_01_FULL_39_28 TaxID=1802496 RepID=A0A1F7YI74_9BACT|nr:MAG: hypothetical protein A2627_02560 [Candidatus Woesebacteria bacterium RIFCSPHIGHO2_01_FULL_39_28]OGM32219.1 MAG: hypothetical protein A3D00_01990 [Candidatus Woesebacteria bacterium RIFCSPHIGHO2_02_FULL_38_9]OGM57210.1 MAG: hypothetical protein A3A50_03420 [Candidatus Woesebacteria bacterium RIFCSPLOWO2_01_FULL_38_20]
MGEEVPKESQTIAAVRSARLAEKISLTKSGFNITRAWWNNTISEALGLIAVLFLNLYLVYPFFGTASPDVVFSGPVVPLIAKVIEYFGVPLQYSMQIVNIIFFLLFPFSFYFFVKKITGRKLISMLSVLMVSLPFYPFGEVRAKAALLGIESSHMATLAIIPLALYGLLNFARDGKILDLVIASISAGVVALISPFGFLTFSILAAVTAFSEVLLGRGRLKLIRLIAVLVFAGGLNSFWYNPVFFYWMITGPIGEDVRLMISRLIPISFFMLPIFGSFGFLFFDRKPDLQSLFMASFFTIAFATIVIAGGGFFPENPSRYAPEFGISLAFLLGVVVVKFTDYLKSSKGRLFAHFFIVLSILFSFVAIIFGRDNLIKTQTNVLGMWTGVEKGEIWIAKDKFRGASQVLGYVITVISLSTLAFLGVKVNKVDAAQ